MTSLPITFVVAFLLLLLVAAYRPQFKETPTGDVFALVLYVNAISLVLIGLRWSKDMVGLLPIVATLAVISSALLYLAFCSLGRRGPVIVVERDWSHLLPIACVALSAMWFRQWVDFSLIATKCLYITLFIRLACNTSNSLQLVRLSWLSNTQRALWGAIALLFAGIILDVTIYIDFARFDGQHAESLVGIVSFGTLLLLGWIVVQAARGRTLDTAIEAHLEHTPRKNPATDVKSVSPESTLGPALKSATDTTPDAAIEPDTAELVSQLTTLLIDDGLYADTELNLQRLARKAGVPSRIISRAINAQTGQNVSQWVNRARIDAACHLLQTTQLTVSNVMLESGFVTKSNFNREFRRIKGCSPSEWRGLA